MKTIEIQREEYESFTFPLYLIEDRGDSVSLQRKPGGKYLKTFFKVNVPVPPFMMVSEEEAMDSILERAKQALLDKGLIFERDFVLFLTKKGKEEN